MRHDDATIIRGNVTKYLAVAEGNMLEANISNIAYGANTIAYPRQGGTMKKFAKKFKGLHKSYVKACLDGSMDVGRVYVHSSEDKRKTIFVLGVQSFPAPFTKIKHVEESLEQALQIIRDDDLLEKELAIPPISCGSGGLSWVEVEPVVKRLAHKYKVKVTVFLA